MLCEWKMSTLSGWWWWCTTKRKAVEFLQMITRTMVLNYDCIKNDQLNRTAFINAKHNANSFFLFFLHRFQHQDVSVRLHIFFALSPFRSGINDNLLCFIRLLHYHLSMYSARNVLVYNYNACIFSMPTKCWALQQWYQYILNMFSFFALSWVLN